MKISKIFIPCLLFAIARLSMAITLAPIQLLNPTGSTSGQAIVSTGASSAPAWGNVSAAALTGLVPIANGGTGQATASAAAHALGLGSNDTPTFFGITINGSTSHGILIGQGNGVPITYSSAGTSGQALISGGASADPSYGALALTALATQAANTVLVNATASIAAPTAVSIPSCSTSSSALNWTSSGGSSAITCNTSINASTLGGSTFASPGPIGSTTASTGKFTTLQATSAITPSTTAGIVGTTTNDNANAGSVGEVLQNSTSTTSATSGAAMNGTSVSLTAGDWDVAGICATNPAGTTTTSIVISGISTTSAVFQNVPGSGGFLYAQAFTVSVPAGGQIFLQAPVTRISVASSTTTYLVCQANFAVSTMTISGYIRARRVR